MKRNAHDPIQLAMAKVVDNMLITGLQEALEKVNSDITKRFKLDDILLNNSLSSTVYV